MGMVSAADVEAELEGRKGVKRASGRNILFLLLSLGLFYTTGLFHGTWISVLTLVTVIFVHEMGHWLGMKCFGYTDLRMFFIPYFGAAVSGKDSGASGERRAIVSLLGPAPGLLLGVGCAFIYLKWRQPILLQFAAAAVVLNAFNLLPIYPLDGGQFMQAVVFSRHPTVETVFKITAAAALAGLATWHSSIRLGILAFGTLILTRESYYQGVIATRLRKIMDAEPLPDTEQMPHIYLEQILFDLGDGLTRKTLNAKLLATRAESVWSRVRQQAPSLGHTIALLGVYVGIVALSVGGLLGFSAANKALNQKTVIAYRMQFNGPEVAVEEIYSGTHKIAETQLNDKGLYNGPSTTWTLTGLKRQEGSWTNGFWQGGWVSYTPDGSIKSITTYEKGRPTRFQLPKDGHLEDVPADDWPSRVKDSLQSAARGTFLKLRPPIAPEIGKKQVGE